MEEEHVANIAKTIVKHGTGSAFYDSQFPLKVSSKDGCLNLLGDNTR